MKKLQPFLVILASLFVSTTFCQTGNTNDYIVGTRLGVGGVEIPKVRIETGLDIDRVIIDKTNAYTGTGYIAFNNRFSDRGIPNQWHRVGNNSHNGGAIITSTRLGDLQFFPVNNSGGGDASVNDEEMTQRMVLKISHNNEDSGHGYIQVNRGTRAVHIGSSDGINFGGNGYIGFNIRQDASTNHWRSLGNGSMNGANVLYSTLDGEFVVSALGSTGAGGSNYTDAEIKSHAVLRVDKNGLLKTKEVKVQTNIWADYVFEDEYQLPTLEEVSNFIQTNKHLPGMPSEQEVIANGIEVGKMNVLLLEKIEELTLYLLDQQDKINALEARLDK